MSSEALPSAAGRSAAADLRVGMIGIGAFGSKIALRLLWSKFPTLQVYDIVDMYSRQFTSNNGGMAVGSPKMLADSCDVVITALPGARELREVCFGWEGLVKGFQKGGIVLDLGFTDPADTIAIGDQLAANGISLVDAPAYGTPNQAREGQLVVVVGGSEAAVERCRPILEIIGRQIIRAGATGSAQATGALADYLRAVEVLAASEVFHIGGLLGLPPGAVIDVAEALKGVKTSAMVRDFVASRNFESGVVLGVVRKSLEHAAKLADGLGRNTALLDATRDALAEAEHRLGWGADLTALGRWLELLQPVAPPAEAAERESTPAA